MNEQRNIDAIILFLIISLSILLLVILYKLLLKYLSKDRVRNEDFCVLYSLEEKFPSGMTEFYFTVQKEKKEFVKFQILDSNWNEITTVKEGEFSHGGHIIRYDIDQLPSGEFYFGIKTKSQETFKKFKKK